MKYASLKSNVPKNTDLVIPDKIANDKGEYVNFDYVKYNACKNIISVTDYSSKKIIDEAFVGCNNLKSVNIELQSGVKDNVQIIKNNIGMNAFNKCANLTNVTISNVKEIENSAFEGCTALTTVKLDANVETIGNSAFKGCTSLKTVAATKIINYGISAFEGCTALTNIYINGSYETDSGNGEIGEYAFKNCKSLENFVAGPNQREIKYNVTYREDYKNISYKTITKTISVLNEKIDLTKDDILPEDKKEYTVYWEETEVKNDVITQIQDGDEIIVRESNGKYYIIKDDTSQESGAPNGGAPNGGAQTGGVPNGGAPNGGAPNGGAPNGGAPNGGAQTGGLPNGGAPNGGAQAGGNPNGEVANEGSQNSVNNNQNQSFTYLDKEKYQYFTKFNLNAFEGCEKLQYIILRSFGEASKILSGVTTNSSSANISVYQDELAKKGCNAKLVVLELEGGNSNQIVGTGGDSNIDSSGETEGEDFKGTTQPGEMVPGGMAPGGNPPGGFQQN